MPSPRRLQKRQIRLFKPIKFFDPKEFLANAGIGRTIQQYGRKQAIFSQGKPADAVYYMYVRLPDNSSKALLDISLCLRLCSYLVAEARHYELTHFTTEPRDLY